MASNKHRVPKSRFTEVRGLLGDNRWLFIVIGLIIGLLVPAAVSVIVYNFDDFLENMVPEFVGIVFTVVIIDSLDRRREDRLIKEQLLRQLHSYYNPVALQAIEELRILGYLSDGSCHNLDLRGADWREGNLYQADLTGSDLRNAKLNKADLVEANLTDTKVNQEQLITTDIMWKCVMPDGKLYDGRFNLPHDFEVARRKGFNPNDSQSMADYYGVPLETYLEGQNWAREHLRTLQNEITT